MYCIRCGTQNREGANFCKHCGVKMDKELPAQKKKKKAGLVAGIVAAVVAFAVAFVAFGGADKMGPTPAAPNPEYVEVFTSRGLDPTPSTFSTKKSIHFVSVTGDNMVEKLEFGYDNDIIKEMVNAVYLSTEAYSDLEMRAVDEAMHETFDPINEHSFVTVSYYTVGEYYVISIRAKELDNLANVSVLKDLGFEADGALLSAKESQKELQKNGYIKR